MAGDGLLIIAYRHLSLLLEALEGRWLILQMFLRHSNQVIFSVHQSPVRGQARKPKQQEVHMRIYFLAAGSHSILVGKHGPNVDPKLTSSKP